MNLGDEVFTVYSSAYDRVEVPCPVCYGKLRVKLTLGDGTKLMIDCEYCKHGFEDPSGVANEIQATARVCSGVVTGVGVRWIEVNGQRHDTDEVFVDRAEADKRREEKYREVVMQARDSNDWLMVQSQKKHTWSAGYSRAEIKRAEQVIAWHSAKMAGCIS